MVNILSLTDKDLETLISIYNTHINIFNENDVLFYKCEINEENYFIVNCDNRYVIYYFKNEDLYYENFMVDEFGQIFVVLDNYVMSLEKVPVFKNIKSGISSQIDIIKRSNGNDGEGFNAILVYKQYDFQNNISLIISRQYMYSDINSNRLYSYNNKEPFYFSFDKVGKKENYIVRKVKSNYMFYDLMLIKEYGLRNYIKYGAFGLEDKDILIKYYKMYGKSFNNNAITFFPFTKQYNLYDLEKKVNDLGFSINIPEEIMEAYNEYHDSFQEYVELIKKIQKIEKENKNPNKLVLKLVGDKYE